MKRLSVVGLALVLVACSGAEVGSGPSTANTGREPSTTQTSADGLTTIAPAATTTIDATPSTTSEPSERELAVFIATMDELLTGSGYEGDAVAEPELFLATGWLFCDWLDQGVDADTVLTRYLDELAGGVDYATDDQLELAGALLGSAVAVLCPSHSDVVG